MLPKQALTLDELRLLLFPLRGPQTSYVASVIFIHDITGDISPYNSLAENLPLNVAVYGVISPAFADRATPRSVTEIAKLYSQVLQQNIKGPMIIVGYSFGGLVANEMQQHLSEASFVFIDTPHPDCSRQSAIKRTIWDTLEKLAELLPAELEIPTLTELVDSDAFDRVVDTNSAAFLVDAVCQYITDKPQTVKTRTAQTQVRLLGLYAQAALEYHPAPPKTSAPPVLIAASESAAKHGSPSLGWHTVVSHEAPGCDHFSILSNETALEVVQDGIDGLIRQCEITSLYLNITTSLAELTRRAVIPNSKKEAVMSYLLGESQELGDGKSKLYLPSENKFVGGSGNAASSTDSPQSSPGAGL